MYTLQSWPHPVPPKTPEQKCVDGECAHGLARGVLIDDLTVDGPYTPNHPRMGLSAALATAALRRQPKDD